MKAFHGIAFATLLGWAVSEEEANPLGKTIQLLDDLSVKIVQDGERAAKAFHKYKEWCDDASHNAMFAIEDATKQKAKLEALVGEHTSDIDVASSRIAKLASATKSADEDLTNATVLRKKEAKTFVANEKELTDTIDALERAIGVLEKERAKKPEALAQLDATNIGATVQALSAILDAASFPADDVDRLQAMLQVQGDSDTDELGSPDAAAYKSHSGGIVDVLGDLKEKADTELSDLRKAETTAKHNFDRLSASLKRQIVQDEKNLAVEKMNKAEAEQGKAVATGNLETTKKSLKNSKEELASTQSACLTTAADYEATLTGRQEELKVIAEAKKDLVDSTSGAESKTYALVQLRAQADEAGQADIVAFMKGLARTHHSAALAQLASQISAVARFGGRSGQDPFAKIKDLIRDLIAKLEKEASADAQEKKYCDEQLSKTKAQKENLEDDIAKMTAKIDSSASMSAQLKAEVKVLQEELAALSKEQAEMDKIRQETHEDYIEAKRDLELGLNGVRKALTTLRDYYGGGGGDEDLAAAMLQQPAAPENHSKVEEYYAKIKERCIAKPETYHERAARRADEIEGLKEALRVLKEEVAFVQRTHPRAGRRHHDAFLAAN
mmetsp:Transcript_99911/g.288502  ORF Transcript_99911/g.288502 Transcript_99911/m.288502 type:complete len:614 (-) Transcript_99911:75-1916(-)